MQVPHRAGRGFTLIELSIVLVVIGLIVGGVLVGQDLIRAAQVRATVSQIEKYNIAANTFKGKYGYLPGDIPAVPAAQFGFVARGTQRGQGDGNGVIEGWDDIGNTYNALGEGAGETPLFWNDLSAANLIDGTFNTASATTSPASNLSLTTTPSIGAYLPVAKLGTNNFVSVYSVGGINYFCISAVYNFRQKPPAAAPGMTVQQAYSIDQKMDDGLPQSGNVTAQFVNYSASQTSPVWIYGANPPIYQGWSPGSAVPANQWYTCYDNANNASNTMKYSVEASGGNNVNCALSFQFQ